MESGDTNMDSLVQLCTNNDGSDKHLKINSYLFSMKNDPIIPLLTLKEPQCCSLIELFTEAERENSPEATSHLLKAILLAEVGTFHKICVHAAMTPSNIKDQFEPVLNQAKFIQKTFKGNPSQLIPFVTVRYNACWFIYVLQL